MTREARETPGKLMIFHFLDGSRDDPLTFPFYILLTAVLQQYLHYGCWAASLSFVSRLSLFCPVPQPPNFHSLFVILRNTNFSHHAPLSYAQHAPLHRRSPPGSRAC